MSSGLFLIGLGGFCHMAQLLTGPPAADYIFNIDCAVLSLVVPPTSWSVVTVMTVMMETWEIDGPAHAKLFILTAGPQN